MGFRSFKERCISCHWIAAKFKGLAVHPEGSLSEAGQAGGRESRRGTSNQNDDSTSEGVGPSRPLGGQSEGPAQGAETLEVQVGGTQRQSNSGTSVSFLSRGSQKDCCQAETRHHAFWVPPKCCLGTAALTVFTAPHRLLIPTGNKNRGRAPSSFSGPLCFLSGKCNIMSL